MRLIALWSVVAFVAQHWAARPVRAQATTDSVSADPAAVVVSELSSANAHPAVAVSPDGKRMVVAWDGVVGGQQRILLRLSVGGAWGKEQVVDANPDGSNSSPSVAIDNQGSVHVAWIGTVAERARVHYAVISDKGVLRPWGPIRGGEDPSDQCNHVVLKLDAKGLPWMAWESGRGTRIGIRVARPDPETSLFTVDYLTANSSAHHAFPDIFFTPAPTVSWYVDEIPAFSLKLAQFDSNAGQWTGASISGFQNLPSDNLPQLMRRDTGRWAACWISEIAQPASNLLAQVFVGEQGDPYNGTGRQAEAEPDLLKTSLGRAVVGSKLVLAWSAKSLEEGWQIRAVAGAELPFGEPIHVTNGPATGYFDQPAVAATSDHSVAVVWTSNAAYGGDGRIYLQNLAI